jgi:hypothetical protein
MSGKGVCKIQTVFTKVIPECKQNMMSLMGAFKLGQNDVTWGQANSIGMPPDPISKQSRVTNLSLYKHWFQHISEGATSSGRKLQIQLVLS